jgi:hypothetical protein
MALDIGALQTGGLDIGAIQSEGNVSISDQINYLNDATEVSAPFDRAFSDTLDPFSDAVGTYFGIFLEHLTKAVADNFIVKTGPPSQRSEGLKDALFTIFHDANIQLQINIDDLYAGLKDQDSENFDEFFNPVGPVNAYDTLQYNWLGIVIVYLVVTRAAWDTLNFYDFISMLKGNFIQKTDTISLSEAINLDYRTLPIGADSFELLDAITIATQNFLTEAKADTLSLSDAVATLLSSSFTSYIRRYLNDLP